MKYFFKDMAERAIKTAAQSGTAMLVMYGAIKDVDWYHVLGAVGIAALISILTSFASFSFGDKCTASAVKLKEDYQNDKSK
jgi:hypothetical protein